MLVVGIGVVVDGVVLNCPNVVGCCVVVVVVVVELELIG